MENNYQQQPPQQPPSAPKDNKSVIILVLGIVSIVLGGIIGLPAGIVGFLMANKMKKEQGTLDSKANAGFICSIIGMAWSAIALVICVCYCSVLVCATTVPMW